MEYIRTKEAELRTKEAELPPIKRKLSKEKYASLFEFIHGYMEKHGFIGLRMVSGLYITKYNPKHDIFDTKELQRTIKRRVSMIIDVYIKLGICERHGKNAIKINGNKLKEFSLNDIKNYAFKN
jgi:hypothetical protein